MKDKEERINIPAARSIIDPLRQLSNLEGDSSTKNETKKENTNRVNQIREFNKNKYKKPSQTTTKITKLIRRK